MRKLALLTVLLGCASDGNEERQTQNAVEARCFAGEPDQAPELEVVYRTADGEQHPALPGEEIPLIQPPQGGKVLFIGVRALHLNGCGATLTTALIEPDSDEVVSLERRPVFLDIGEDGWLQPRQPAEMSNYSNLPACPRANLARSISGESYALRVSLTDQEGRSVERKLAIVPKCGEAQHLAACECECSKDYVLGGTCEAAEPPP